MGLIVMFIAGLAIGIVFMSEIHKADDLEKHMQDAEIIKLQAEIDKLKENK